MSNIKVRWLSNAVINVLQQIEFTKALNLVFSSNN